MPDQLALVYYRARDTYLDPNETDLGITDKVWRELRYTPDGRRRTIGKGILECTRCLDIGRDPASIYVRVVNGRRQIAHHASGAAPCYAPESDEHKAMKERVATTSQRAGYSADVESSSPARRSRPDVTVHGASGLTLGWEIQLTDKGPADAARRSTLRMRERITPSWLTTLDRPSFINRVPWSIANLRTWERILNDRSLQIVRGAVALRYLRCREFSLCPQAPPGRVIRDCGKWHSRWEPVSLRADEFIAKAAAGVYVPAAIPGTRGVARWWVTVEDRDHYAAAHGHPCTEGALPERVRLGGRDAAGRGNTQDSLLHHPRAQGRAATRAGNGESRALVDPGVWVHTLDTPPDIQSTALRPEVAAWLARGIGGGTDQPCKYYLGSEGRYCDATPTRPFQNGRYCYDHVPGSHQL